MAVYEAGNVIRCQSNPPFTTGGSPVDPPTVKFVCEYPDKSTFIRATWTGGGAGSDPNAIINRESTGLYHADVDATQAGTYRYRWYSPDVNKASKWSSFSITASNLV